MPINRFVISAMQTGLQNDVKPFLLPQDAFTQLQNAYVYRGRIKKRWGATLMNTGTEDDVAQLYSRVRINIGTTNGAGIFAPVVVPGIVWKIGQMFSIGDEIYTVFQANGAMYCTFVGPIASFDTATGTVQFAGTLANTAVYFYPSEPIMGLPSYENAQINNEQLIAFDTQFSYYRLNDGWERTGTVANKVWTGNNSQFFYTENYRGQNAATYTMFATNFNAPDFMATMTGVANDWQLFRPAYNAAMNTIDSCRVIIAFAGRLLLLNTIETGPAGQLQYPQRCRFSQNGNPLEANAYYELASLAGKGGYIDASTLEAIIGAKIIKGRLIVFFERSTWEIISTKIPAQPFYWQQVNSDMGVESTFSLVNFDNIVMGIGQTGIIACNGSSVQRLDEKIPREVFNIRNENEGIVRVQGIRDFYNELVYWTFPTLNVDNTYPTQVLVFNYIEGSWSFFDDSVTTFGYYQAQEDLIWGNANMTWGQADFTWGAAPGLAQFRSVVCGNQEGFVFVVNSGVSVNCPALSITDMNQLVSFQRITLVVIDHNLNAGEFILIENIVGTNAFIQLNGFVWKVDEVIDEDSFIVVNVEALNLPSQYAGGGTITRVSRVDMTTKMYNFYPDQARNMAISKVDFNIDATGSGKVTVDYMTSSSPNGALQNALQTGAILGNNVLSAQPYPLSPQETNAQFLIHPVYINSQGEWIQLRIFYSDEQMLERDNPTWQSPFDLNAMVFYVNPSSIRFQ